MGNKLYVGNLPYSVRDQDLEQAFGQFGAVTSAKVMMERDTGRSKGFGFVEMGSDDEAQAAINGMNGQPLGGRNVVVNEARPMEARPPRSGGFGGGGGGGYGGGGGGATAAVAAKAVVATAAAPVVAVVAMAVSAAPTAMVRAVAVVAVKAAAVTTNIDRRHPRTTAKGSFGSPFLLAGVRPAMAPLAWPCAVAPPATGRTGHWAAGAALSPPAPSARE